MSVDGDRYDEVSAAVALWKITSNANLALPIILHELPQSDTKVGSGTLVNTLKDMGPRAKVAFPVLLDKLPWAADYHARRVITEALKAIDPEAADKAGIK
jgi:hypothetical protein